ncbi:allene oxide synthase-lipoxygenase protein-like isoform X7 [Tachypleus tridentatus]|uniref:allene oxide synthase-lipoxygenase protein-like isoform X7 n=1 Tax=Tachypleus tridentatus TaxID=6853 RepID=UPI003FD4E623
MAEQRTQKYEVHVVTGDRFGAGTDANVWLVLHDGQGQKSSVVKLNSLWTNDHERNTTGKYVVTVAEDFGEVIKVEFWRDSYGFGDDWFLDRIEVHKLPTEEVHYYPVHRWVVANVHYVIHEFDCTLPEDDHNIKQRQTELERIRDEYRIHYHVPGGPAQVGTSWKLPSDEKFSDDYKWDIIKNKGSLLVAINLINLATKDKWESFEDLETVYRWNLEKPELTAPIALFFLNEKKDLMPIAIQLFQDERPKNPVFLPSDPKYTWLLAKIIFNNADATYHQSCTHLGFTHLLMEGVVVCTHRNLSPSHPLFKLMAPHFLYLLAINARGLDKLLSVNGWVDQTMTVGRCGMFELIKRSFEKWRLDINGIIPNDFQVRKVSETIPNDFQVRKVDDPNVLPYYPYRDDSTAIFTAIRNYVTKVVKFYYDEPQKVTNDTELQHWREELVLSRNEGGVGLLGVPGESGKFTTVDQVIDVVSVVISTCSIGHAAANFQQYSEYGFPPNYPGIVCDEIIQDKRPRTLQDVLRTLPDKETTLDIMVITKLLSARGTKSLGDFEVQYLYHPVCVRAAQEFRAELKAISKNIQQRNKTADFPYSWLDPEIVPNSISI